MTTVTIEAAEKIEDLKRKNLDLQDQVVCLEEELREAEHQLFNARTDEDREGQASELLDRAMFLIDLGKTSGMEWDYFQMDLRTHLRKWR